MMDKEQRLSYQKRENTCLFSLSLLLCLLLSAVLINEETSGKDYVILLHSEWSEYDHPDHLFDKELANQGTYEQLYDNGSYDELESEDASTFISKLARSLKRGGGSSRSSSSSRSGSSYGNCYGDRCDNTGGSTSAAIIVGCVVGGCVFILLIYCLISYCIEKKKKAAKKARKKNKKNRVGSES